MEPQIFNRVIFNQTERDELIKEIKRLYNAIEEIKGTAGACSKAEVGKYGLYEYCQKIQDNNLQEVI